MPAKRKKEEEEKKDTSCRELDLMFRERKGKKKKKKKIEKNLRTTQKYEPFGRGQLLSLFCGLGPCRTDVEHHPLEFYFVLVLVHVRFSKIQWDSIKFKDGPWQ